MYARMHAQHAQTTQTYTGKETDRQTDAHARTHTVPLNMIRMVNFQIDATGFLRITYTVDVISIIGYIHLFPQ